MKFSQKSNLLTSNIPPLRLADLSFPSQIHLRRGVLFYHTSKVLNMSYILHINKVKTMAAKSIIICEKNREAIENMITQAEGKATARCLTFKGLTFRIAQLETALGIAKKDMEGVKYDLDDHAQNFPHAYKYKADSTHAVIERRGGKWRLTKVYRYTCRSEKHTFHCLGMPETVQTAILDSRRYF